MWDDASNKCDCTTKGSPVIPYSTVLLWENAVYYSNPISVFCRIESKVDHFVYIWTPY